MAKPSLIQCPECREPARLEGGKGDYRCSRCTWTGKEPALDEALRRMTSLDRGMGGPYDTEFQQAVRFTLIAILKHLLRRF